MQGRFFDGLTAHPHHVDVVIEGGIMRIQSADHAVAEDWLLKSTSVRLSSDGVATLRSGAGPARLVIDNSASLLDLRVSLCRWPRPQRGWGFVLGVGIPALAVVLLLVVSGPALLAPLLPASWEDAVGRRMEHALVMTHGQCHGVQGQRALDRFMANLAASVTLPEVRLVVVNDGLINAFTLPGHRIVVERGLLDAAEDGEELAGVLGHEAGHIAHLDPERAQLHQLSLSVVAEALGWSGASGGGVARTLMDLSFGRTAERAADAFSVEALSKAGLRADGLEHFFAHMQGKWADGPTFFSDHPSTAERRAQVAKPPTGLPAFTNDEWQAIRTMCRNE